MRHRPPAMLSPDRGRAFFRAAKALLAGAVFAFLSAPREATALPLAEPVSRAFTSLEGRKVELTIDGVTEDTLEGLRIPGGDAVSLPIARLSAADRAFAAELRARAEGAQQFSRSPWVDALAADLWTSGPGETAGLIASEPTHWAGCAYFLVVVTGRLDGGSPLAFPKKLSPQRRAALGIVTLYSVGGAVDAVVHAETAGAPSGFLRDEKVRAMRRVVLDLEREFSASTRLQRGDQPAYRTETFGRECLRRLPAYWPRPPLGAGIFDESDPGSPQAYLFRRDGTPARLAGRPVAGGLSEVVRILEGSYAKLH